MTTNYTRILNANIDCLDTNEELARIDNEYEDLRFWDWSYLGNYDWDEEDWDDPDDMSCGIYDDDDIEDGLRDYARDLLEDLIVNWDSMTVENRRLTWAVFSDVRKELDGFRPHLDEYKEKYGWA